MYLDVVDMRAFYKLPIGRIVQQALAARLAEHWPARTGERVAGIGFATPYLAPYLGTGERTLALMPAPQGVIAWPNGRANLTTLIPEDNWPLPDAALDRLIAIHGLEMADSPRAFLSEAWRVLAPGGRLIVAVPNRRGLWARGESSPFGYGRPYSRGQLSYILKDAQFTPKRFSEALHFPPSGRRWLLRSSGAFERVGTRLWPAFAGLILVEAEKRIFKGVAARERAAAVVLRPVFVPQAAPRSRS